MRNTADQINCLKAEQDIPEQDRPYNRKGRRVSIVAGKFERIRDLQNMRLNNMKTSFKG